MTEDRSEPRPTEIRSERVPGGRADLTPRTFARIIDHVIWVPVGYGLFSLIAQVWPIGRGDSLTVFVASLAAFQFVVNWLYFGLQEHFFGRTIGKRLMKLETKGASGGRPSLREAMVRNCYVLLAFLAFIPGLGSAAVILPLLGGMIVALSINNDEDLFQGWHDQWAGGTFVVWDSTVKPRAAS